MPFKEIFNEVLGAVAGIPARPYICIHRALYTGRNIYIYTDMGYLDMWDVHVILLCPYVAYPYPGTNVGSRDEASCQAPVHINALQPPGAKPQLGISTWGPYIYGPIYTYMCPIIIYVAASLLFPYRISYIEQLYIWRCPEKVFRS